MLFLGLLAASFSFLESATPAPSYCVLHVSRRSFAPEDMLYMLQLLSFPRHLELPTKRRPGELLS